MDRRVTPPKRGSSPTWGPPPPCKQALSHQLPISLQLSLGSFYISGLNATLTCFNALFPRPTCAVVRASCVCTIRIFVTIMASLFAFVDV